MVDYFLQHYGITLAMPHLPCLKVGREFDPVEIPMEVCKFLPGQVKRDLTSEQKVHPLTSCLPYTPLLSLTIPYTIPFFRLASIPVSPLTPLYTTSLPLTPL